MSVKEILRFLDACVILHNFLLGFGERDIDYQWIESDDTSQIDDYNRLPPEDELNQPVPNGVPGNFRRTQLLHYIMEIM